MLKDFQIGDLVKLTTNHYYFFNKIYLGQIGLVIDNRLRYRYKILFGNKVVFLPKTNTEIVLL